MVATVSDYAQLDRGLRNGVHATIDVAMEALGRVVVTVDPSVEALQEFLRFDTCKGNQKGYVRCQRSRPLRGLPERMARCGRGLRGRRL